MSFIKNKQPAPTAQFLAGELDHGEDVEVLLSSADGSFSHYVTLTDFTFDVEAKTGRLSFIDPMGGSWETRNITSSAPNGALVINYSTDCPNCQITDAVSESPIPEPSSVMIIASA